MGIFDFLKNPFGSKDADPDKIVASVRQLGLNVQNLAVAVASGVATVTGLAVNRAEASKVVMAIGNSPGITRVNNQMRVPLASLGGAAPRSPGADDDDADEDDVRFHTVESGDTLSKISKEVYGDANKYNQIFEANKPMLTSPDKIYPGQVLRIPPEN